jgi:hypothetical protein
MICLRFRTAALAVLFAAAPATAQDGHLSHVLIETPDQDEALRSFRERIRRAQQEAGLADALKQFGGKMPFDLEQLQKALQKDPKFKDLVEGVQKGDRDKLDQFQDLLQKAKGSGMLGPLDPAVIKQAEDKLQELRSQSPAGPPGNPVESDGQPPISPPLPTDPPPDPAERAARQEINQQLADFAQRFPKEHLPEQLRNSPALQDAFHRLSDYAADALRHPDRPDGIDAQLARLKIHWDGLQEWLPKQIPEAMRKLQLPDITRMIPAKRSRWPVIELPSAPPAPRLGRAPGGIRPAMNTILVIAGVVVLAVVFWRLRGGRLAAAGEGRRPLGPWPVDPASIASRADLIRAFEYLSLLRCGEPARTWHHRAIADCLGGAAEDRRAAAARLAELYEQARYAPAGGGEPDWTAARGPMTVLARAG